MFFSSLEWFVAAESGALKSACDADLRMCSPLCRALNDRDWTSRGSGTHIAIYGISKYPILCGVIIEGTRVLSLEMVAEAAPLTRREKHQFALIDLGMVGNMRLRSRTKLEGETWQ